RRGRRDDREGRPRRAARLRAERRRSRHADGRARLVDLCRAASAPQLRARRRGADVPDRAQRNRVSAAGLSHRGRLRRPLRRDPRGRCRDAVPRDFSDAARDGRLERRDPGAGPEQGRNLHEPHSGLRGRARDDLSRRAAVRVSPRRRRVRLRRDLSRRSAALARQARWPAAPTAVSGPVRRASHLSSEDSTYISGPPRTSWTRSLRMLPLSKEFRARTRSVTGVKTPLDLPTTISRRRSSSPIMPTFTASNRDSQGRGTFRKPGAPSPETPAVLAEATPPPYVRAAQADADGDPVAAGQPCWSRSRTASAVAGSGPSSARDETDGERRLEGHRCASGAHIARRRDRDFAAAAANGLARVLAPLENRRSSRTDRCDSLVAVHVVEHRAREEIDGAAVREAIAPEDELSADPAVLAGRGGARQARHHVLRRLAEYALGRLANAQRELLSLGGYRRKQ